MPPHHKSATKPRAHQESLDSFRATDPMGVMEKHVILAANLPMAPLLNHEDSPYVERRGSVAKRSADARARRLRRIRENRRTLTIIAAIDAAAYNGDLLVRGKIVPICHDDQGKSGRIEDFSDAELAEFGL